MTTIFDIAARLMAEALDDRDDLHVQLSMANNSSAHYQQLFNKLADDLKTADKAHADMARQLNASQETLKQYRTPNAAAAPQGATQSTTGIVNTIDTRNPTPRAGPGPDVDLIRIETNMELIHRLEGANEKVANLMQAVENHKGAEELFRQANGTLTSRCNDLLNKNITLEARARKAERISEVFMREVTDDEARDFEAGMNRSHFKQKLREFIRRRVEQVQD